MNIASEQEIVMVGQWLAGKNIAYSTAKNIVSITGVFILNNARPKSKDIFAPSKALTVSEIGYCVNDTIALYTIRRIMLMLEKNNMAICSNYEHSRDPQEFEMEFYCIANQLGFWNSCPANQKDIGVPLNTLLNVFADVIEVIKTRGLCDE